MSKIQSISLKRRPREQREDQGWCNLAFIRKVISVFSTFFSFAGMSLLGVIFFGLADMLDYRKTKLIYECSHYMVIAAVVLFFLAFLLSFFKEESNQNSPVDVTQMNVKESTQFENNRILNLGTNKLNPTDKLQIESSTKVVQDTFSENIKPKDTSSKILSFSSLDKQEITSTITSLSSSCKNIDADRNKQQKAAITLPPNISSKINKNAVLVNQGEITGNLPTHTSCKTLQQTSTSNRPESTSNLSPNISSKALITSSTSEQRDCAKILSPNISSKQFQNAITSEQKVKTLNPSTHNQTMDEKPSHISRQLVPYKKNSKIPFCGQTLQTPPHQGRYFQEFASPNASGCCPFTEITATKKMTFSPWGVVQEESQIQQRIFYNDPQNPMGGISPQFGLKRTLNYDPNSGGIAQHQINQTTFYQYPSSLESRLSSSTSRLQNNQNRISSSMFNQPHQNKVSDVLTRLDCMNIFH